MASPTPLFDAILKHISNICSKSGVGFAGSIYKLVGSFFNRNAVTMYHFSLNFLKDASIKREIF